MAMTHSSWLLPRTALVAFAAVACLGCSDGGDAATDADTAAGDTAASVDTSDTAAPADTATAAPTLLGDCERPDGAAVNHRVILSERFRCSPPATPTEAVVTDAANWDAMAAGIADCTSPRAVADPVDFESEYVVVLGTMAFMTCGFDDDGVTVLAGDGGPWVELAVTDRSAGCPGQCASGDGYVVAVAIPRSAGESPSLCRRVNPGCP